MVSEVQYERRALRKSMRQCRNALSPMQQTQASQQLLRLLQSQPIFQRSKHIAAYLASDGEVNLGPVIERAWELGKKVYLPVLQPQRTYRLWFVEYTPQTSLHLNYYDLLEPRVSETKPLPARCLDLVLTPLVAFDRLGARLGMGGGYYDRTFAFKQKSKSTKPYLLGISHSCQETEKLDLQSWDIPLHGIATEQRVFGCGSGSGRDFR